MFTFARPCRDGRSLTLRPPTLGASGGGEREERRPFPGTRGTCVLRAQPARPPLGARRLRAAPEPGPSVVALRPGIAPAFRHVRGIAKVCGMKGIASSWAVVTADQIRSRRSPDAVPVALAALAQAGLQTALSFDRTVGDEIQGLTRHVDDVLSTVKILTRLGEWRIGIGIGEVEVPLPTSTRAARGSAFIAAREAVTLAYRAPAAIAVRWGHEEEAPLAPLPRASREPAEGAAVGAATYAFSCSPQSRADDALTAWRALISRRTDEGWQAVTLVESGLTHRAVADRLGVSESAISQRLTRARDAEAAAAERLAGCALVDLMALPAAHGDRGEK